MGPIYSHSENRLSSIPNQAEHNLTRLYTSFLFPLLYFMLIFYCVFGRNFELIFYLWALHAKPSLSQKVITLDGTFQMDLSIQLHSWRWALPRYLLIIKSIVQVIRVPAHINITILSKHYLTISKATMVITYGPSVDTLFFKLQSTVHKMETVQVLKL